MDGIFFVYAACFGVGLLFSVVSAFLANVFGGHELSSDTGAPDVSTPDVSTPDAHPDGGAGGHAEAGYSSHDMPGFAPLSPTTIACFITAFGGIGMVLSRVQATRSPFLSAPLAAVGAFGVAALVFWLFNAVFRWTQASSESNVGQLAGALGTVITAIPADGVGQIAYVDGGTRYTAPARNEYSGSLVAGQAVRITRVVGTTYYVTTV